MKRAIYSAILLCSFVIGITPATAKTFEPKTTHDPQKTWTIAFNSEILFNNNIENYIYIKTESGDQHPVSLDISEDSKKVIVVPKTPFLMGESYSLVITKDVQSSTNKPLKEENSMSFKVQGKHIQSIQAALNPLVTNIVVQGTKEVSSMSVSINGTNETPLHLGKNDQFSRGVPGLINGDEIHVRAYTGQGDLLEEQTYRISN